MTERVNNETPPVATTMPTLVDLNTALRKVSQNLKVGLHVVHANYGIFLILMSWLNFQQANSSVALWLVKIFPLLIFIPGFIKQKYRTYNWLCFAILPYFIWMTPLVMGRGHWSDWVMIMLTVLIFIASMMTSRWMQQQSYLGWQISNTPINTLQTKS